MDTGFSATLKTQNGKFYFIIPEWRLIAEGESVEIAYQELLRKKEDLVRQFSSAGASAVLQFPADDVAGSGARYRKLLLFLAKAVTITAVVVWGILIVVWAMERAAKSTMHAVVQTAKQAPMDLLQGIGDRLVHEAEAEKTATETDRKRMREKEEARLRALRLMVGRVKPYFDEIAVLSPCQQDVTSKRGR
jgi:hypothetical protein